MAEERTAPQVGRRGLVARSWGYCRRNPKNRTQGSAVYAIGGQADGTGRRTGRPPLATSGNPHPD